MIRITAYHRRTLWTAAAATRPTTLTIPAPTRIITMSSELISASPFFDGVKVYSSMPMPPSFSAGTDKDAATESLRSLITPAAGGKWTLTANGSGLERSFKFSTFNKTWDFMNAVAAEAKKSKHHPEWSNVYSTTFIRWTTHHPKGLSDKDLELALTCDFLAKQFGEVGADKTSCGLTGLTDTVAAIAGDCCVPNKIKTQA